MQMNVIQLSPQAEEESQMSHHRSPYVVHQDRFGHLKTVYQVITGKQSSMLL